MHSYKKPADPSRFHKLDTSQAVFFYEAEFYPLSNFSAFKLHWEGREFHTSEAAYQWEKFRGNGSPMEMARNAILNASSAHQAFKIAESCRNVRHMDWDVVKVPIMERILRAKIHQHTYVMTKLLETGNRLLVEDSWRDGFWGWGEDRKGQNMLGKLWMKLRKEIQTGVPAEMHER